MASWIKSCKAAERAAGQFGRDVLLGTTCLFAVAGLCGTAEAGGLPSHGHYVAGDGSISKTNQSLTVKQSSTTAIINWSSFSVGGKNRVTFDNGSGATLNRVTGGNLSTIAGSLHATGSLYLMNAQGVVISGSGKVVTGGSFVATSGNISDTAFGDTRFKPGAGKIVNRGTIIASGATLSGSDVSDTGTIRASQINLTAQHKLAIDGALNARNADGSGGAIIATAKHIAVGSAANIDASGTKGGTVLIGGDIHGGSIASDNFVQQNVKTAETTSIAKGAHINANGSNTAGGNIVIWSDGHTTFDGKISAKGQTAGGFAEVSSHNLLGFTGTANLTTSHGKTGSLLLDPYDVVISNDADTTETNNSGFFSSSGDTSVLSVATIEAALATENVIVSTGNSGSSGSQAGNISVIAPVTWSSGETLTLLAANSIVIGAPIKVTGVGDLDIDYGTTFNVINGIGSVEFSNLNSVLRLNSSVDYILVNSISQLAGDIAADPNGDFALASSIVAPTTAYTSSPIPTTFTGKLLGLGNSITNLKIDDTTHQDVGLFANVGSGAEIDDLDLKNPSIIASGTQEEVGAIAGVNDGTLNFVRAVGGSVTGGNSTSGDGVGIGGLVGENEGSVTFSSASDAVKGGNDVDIGGLAGADDNGMIANSSASGAVSATTGSVAAGGLVGSMDGASGQVTASYATGSVEAAGSGRIGGLVGLSESGNTITGSYASGAVVGGLGSAVGGLAGLNAGTITNTYALGAVTGGGESGSDPSTVGGLIGQNASTGTITASYSVGKVGSTGTGDEIGGFIGDNENLSANSVAGGYFDTDTPTAKKVGSGTFAPIGHGSEEGITGLTTAQMMDSADMPGLTFGASPGSTGFVIFSLNGSYNNSGNVAGGTLPMLLDEATAASNIHMIANAHQLQLVGLDLNGTYFLDGNIDMSATSSGKDVWTAASGFSPIIGPGFAAFEGNLFGLGASIQNLFIDSDMERVGLFYSQFEGLIENLTLSNANVTGTYALGTAEVGALVGEAYFSSSVRDVSVSGKVQGPSGSSDEVGGIFGTTDAVDDNLSSSATVSDSGAGSLVGGLIGGAGGDSSVVSSHATGSVTATGGGGANAGGLIGSSGASIEDSYATGNVTGGDDSYVGGLVGESYNSILQSHATGAVKGGASSFIGGLVGDNTSSSGGIGEDYATGAVSGTTGSDIGGLVGENDSLAVASFATGAVTGGASSDLGGFAGVNMATIVEAYALGSVMPTSTGAVHAGGLVGENASAGQIAQAYATGFVKGTVAAGSGGLVGANDSTSATAIQASYWDTETTGMSSGLAVGTAQAGITGKTTAQLQSALPSDFDPADWSIVAGKSFAYLDWQAPSGTPEVISGTISGTGNAGIGVSVLVNGAVATPLASMASGANGYYYELVAPGTIASSGSDVLAYTRSGSHANVFDLGATGSLTGLNLTGNSLTVDSVASSSSAMLSAMNTAVGSSASSAFLYTSAGGFISGIDLDLNLSAVSFNIDSAINVGTGTLDLAAKGKVTQSSAGSIKATTLTGSSAGSAVMNSASNAISDLGAFTAGSTLEITDDRTLTVDGAVSSTAAAGTHLTSVGAGHNIAIDAAMTADDLYLVSSGAISESSAGNMTAVALTGSSVGAAQMNSALNRITDLKAFAAGSTFELTDDHALVVDGAVSSTTAASTHLTTVGTGDNISINAAMTADDLYLISAGTIGESSAGRITAVAVTGSSAGSALMNGATNVIGDLKAFTAGGTFELTDDSTLKVIGTVSSGTSSAHLTTAGSGHNIAIDAAMTAANLYLISGGTISESSAGDLDVTTALTGSSAGSTVLNSALNTIADLGAFTTSGNAAFELTDDHALTVDGAVSAGTGTLDLTTVGAGHNLVIDANITGGTINLVTTGSASEAGTAAITAAKLNVTANTGINLTSTHNAITKLGSDKTNSGPNKVTL